MARGIIAAMEEFNDGSGAEYSEGEYYVPDMETYDSIDQDSDAVIDSIDTIATHTDITDIIATEGLGNRPQIAAIALSALETKLFGKPVVGTRIGVESLTTIAIEGKNIFIRVWEAIVKFIKKIFSYINDFFGAKKEKEWKDNYKEAKTFESKFDANKTIQKIKAIEKDSPQGKELEKLMSSPYLYGYDSNKKEIVKPVAIAKSILDNADYTDTLKAAKEGSDRINKIFNAKSDAEVDNIMQEINKINTDNFQKLKGLNNAAPNMSYFEIDVQKFKMTLVKHPNATEEIKQQISFDVAKEVAVSMIQEVKEFIYVSKYLAEILPKINLLKDNIKEMEKTAKGIKSYVAAGFVGNKNVSLDKMKEVVKLLTDSTQIQMGNLKVSIKSVGDIDKFSQTSMSAIKRLVKM